MNGASAEPSIKRMKIPNNTSRITMGASHIFFRTRRNNQNSLTIPNRSPMVVKNLILSLPYKSELSIKTMNAEKILTIHDYKK